MQDARARIESGIHSTTVLGLAVSFAILVASPFRILFAIAHFPVDSIWLQRIDAVRLAHSSKENCGRAGYRCRSLLVSRRFPRWKSDYSAGAQVSNWQFTVAWSNISATSTCRGAFPPVAGGRKGTFKLLKRPAHPDRSRQATPRVSRSSRRTTDKRVVAIN